MDQGSHTASLNEVKRVVAKWLEIKNLSVVEVILGAVVANLLEGDPFWLMLIGPPSSAKTELLRALAKFEKIYLLSSLTPQTLISGKVTRKGKCVSLLPKLTGKIVILKDFTTCLTMRREQRAELFSQLREVYDGQYSKAFGTGAEVNWEGKVGFICGVTPIIDRFSSVNQMLGERFIQYRMEPSNPKNIGKRAKKMCGQEKNMRSELQDVFASFLRGIEKTPLKLRTYPEVDDKLINLAIFCATGRTGVSRDRYTRAIDVIPLPEGPGRLVKQFTQLAVGLSVVARRSGIDDYVYELLKKIGLDTLPGPREKFIRNMWAEGYTADLMSWATTGMVADLVGLPTSTAKNLLEDMMVLQLTNRRMEDPDSDKVTPYEWQLSRMCVDLIRDAELYQRHDGEKTEVVL